MKNDKAKGRIIVFPEERIKKGMPAYCAIHDLPRSIFLSYHWGREQTTARRIFWFSLLFPFPDRIRKGNGIFEEIIFRLKNLQEVECEGNYGNIIELVRKDTDAAIISKESGYEPHFPRGEPRNESDIQLGEIFVTSIHFAKKIKSKKA